jgi:cytidylate kinase
MSIAADRIVDTLARAHSYLTNPQAAEPAPPLNIAISRQAGARGTEVGKAIAAQLGWQAYDHELLTRIAQEKGLKERLLEHFDERYVSWLEEVMSALSNDQGPLDATYFNELMRLFKVLARTGHCVIVGRGAPFALPVATTLRLRLIAPREDRVTHMEQVLGVPRREAERWVDQHDHDREAFVKYHFSADENNPLGYDLVLNSGRFDTEQCAVIVVQAARFREPEASGKQRDLQQQGLAAG